MRRAAGATIAWVLVSTLLACGGSHSELKTKPSDMGRGHAPYKPSSLPKRGPEDKAPPSVVSHVVAEVPDKTVGPFVARHGTAAMVAFIASTEGGTRRVVGVPLGADGSPGEAHVISATGPDSTTLVLRPSGGEGLGFVAAWTDLTDRGEALTLVGVGAKGVPIGAPVEVARTPDDIVWVEIVPTSRGGICVWAEQTREGQANVLSVALDPNGKPRGVPSRVARGVVGWQAVSAAAGAGLALVSPVASPGDKKAAARQHTLRWLRLDADAQPIGQPVAIASSSAPIVDGDVTRVGERFVFAWTERSGLDPEVAVASIDLQSKVTAARVVTPRSGGATLAGVAGGTKGGLLVWEEASKRPHVTRRLHLESLDAEPSASARADRAGGGALLEVDGAGTPEVVPAGEGFALLVRARACDSADPESACAQAPSVPTFVRLDERLGVAQTEPIRLGDSHDPAAIAWGLGCGDSRCTALAARGEPAAVSMLDLSPRAGRYRAPVAAALEAGAPRLIALSTILAGQRYAELAAARISDLTMVATLGAASSGPGGPGSGAGAAVAVRVIADSGEDRTPPGAFRAPALAVGGVAIASGGTAEDGSAVAWVARDDGDPEVHVARLDKRGQKVRAVRLTMSKGDASDVAVAWASGGWWVAWVDGRDGNGEVYATKVGLDLKKVAREERITDAPGDASDVTLLGREAGAWLAWADPRESPHDGFADIYAAHLGGSDAKPDVSESRVLATAAHSRSPVLAPADGPGVAIAWIEEAPLGIDSANTGAYGAMVGELDAKGHPSREPLRTLGAGEGFPTAVALDRAGGALHVVLARSTHDDLILDALEPGRERQPSGPRAYAMLRLDGPPTFDVSLSLLGDVLYFNDDGPEPRDGRARRAQLGW